MASKSRNMFYENKKQETTEIGNSCETAVGVKALGLVSKAKKTKKNEKENRADSSPNNELNDPINLNTETFLEYSVFCPVTLQRINFSANIEIHEDLKTEMPSTEQEDLNVDCENGRKGCGHNGLPQLG
ncbi:hypothetical protein AAG570_002818 [Ranatra chinensis]|uniref:Uncharacterized protein n=1 Tax=Ranatra chinensis TaxID=642074 RepID=A0ABD0YHE2_9HEMI